MFRKVVPTTSFRIIVKPSHPISSQVSETEGNIDNLIPIEFSS